MVAMKLPSPRRLDLTARDARALRSTKVSEIETERRHELSRRRAMSHYRQVLLFFTAVTRMLTLLFPSFSFLFFYN